MSGVRADAVEDDVAAIARIDAVATILQVVCRTTGMGFAAVARVTQDRWVACAVLDEIEFGLQPGGELKVETTICHEIRASGRSVVIGHVAEDRGFREHPTPAMYGFQSYISVPIRRASGAFFGTLCAIDPRPRQLTAATEAMFELFADLIGFHLDAQERLATSSAALLGERQAGELREQFIAVLGHDLRNPLSAIDAGARLLRKAALDPKAQATLTLVQDSTKRMAELIDNVLDLTRARLGGGLVVEAGGDAPLQPALLHVVSELRAVWPDRVIEAEIDLRGPVECDHARIAQLLSNLLANALTHGAVDRPVVVKASVQAGRFELEVANAGEPIPQATLERLFQPFFRAPSPAGHRGLGLGLYIASEIARAHGGRLDVTSTGAATRFVLTMPASRAIGAGQGTPALLDR